MQFHPPGTRIAGHYEVAGRPMIGGMGIVYICLDLEEDRPVTLKTFKPEYLPDRAARDRFLREGTHWVELGAHPHIVRCHEVVRVGDGTEVYLVQELVAKEQGRDDASLRSWLTPGVPLPAEQALLFALQIARGMQHAVKTIPGFVHRDLKPENILVGADRLTSADINRLRVTDFGLVRALGRGEVVSAVGGDEPLHTRPGLTRLGSVVGTPPYMAPEQWDGPEVNLHADIYALGCILGEMLSGQMLVRESTLHGFRDAHQGGRAAEVTADLPGSRAGVLSRCLAVDPEARYGSWAEVDAALADAFRAVTGRPAPELDPAAALGSAERVAAGWSYSAMGVSYLDLGQAETALGYFERARAVGAAEGERGLESSGLTHLGLTYKNLGDARQAIGCYEQALAIDREIGDRRGEGVDLGNLGNAYAALGDARRAINYCEQTLAIAREIGDRQGEGAVLNNLGLAYADLGDARRAIGTYEQSLEIKREIGDRRGEGNALGNLGLAYADLGDARQAIGCYEQALAIDREIGHRRGEGAALGNLGNAYFQLGEAWRAIGFYKLQLVITREIGDRRGEGAALGNLGSAYADLGDARQAVDYYEQALEIKREIGNVAGVASTSFNLALLYAQQSEVARALPLAEGAAQIWTQIGHTGNAQRVQQLLAQIRADLG